MGRLKKFWNDTVGSKIIAQGILDIVKNYIFPGIIILGGIVVPYFAGWWPRIGQLVLSKSELPNWLIVILVLLASSKIAGIAFKFLHKLKRSPDAWKLYKKDKIHGIVWRWSYDIYGDIVMRELRPYCPNSKCDGDLGISGTEDPYSSEPISLRCPDCDTTLVTLEKTTHDIDKILGDFMQIIHLEIKRRIRKLRKI